MRFLTFIYFYFFISIILTDDYNYEEYVDENNNDYKANWEIIPDAADEGKKSSNLESGLSSINSQNDSYVLVNIIHSVWEHLTGLADEIERLEKHLGWGMSNDTISAEFNDTDDYPDNNGSKELDVTEINQANKYKVNTTRILPSSNGNRMNSTPSTSKPACNGRSCSNAMTIKTGSVKFNGTSVKQSANRMEIEKLTKWQDQIENCKRLLQKNPNATLEDISRLKHTRKVKEIAKPMKEHHPFRSNGWPYVSHIRRKRGLTKQSMPVYKDAYPSKTHKTFHKVRRFILPINEKGQSNFPQISKMHNLIFK